MISQWVKVESALAKWILQPNRRLRHPITTLALIMYGDEIKSIRNGRCPFCGRRFRKIVAHLNGRVSSRLVLGNWRFDAASFSVYTNPCYVAFQQMIEDILETYLRFRNEVIHVGGGCMYDSRRFGSLTEALKFWASKNL